MASITTIYHYDNGDEFPVEWAEAEHAGQSYHWDAQHTPFACTPLATDYLAEALSQLIQRGRPQSQVSAAPPMAPPLMAHPHGFMYIAGNPDSLPNSVVKAIQEDPAGIGLQVSGLLQTWETEYAPQVQSACLELQNEDYSSATISALPDRLRISFSQAIKGWNATMNGMRPMVASHLQLLLFCREAFSEDADALANVLEHGFANATSSAHIALWKLAQLAKDSPPVMKLLHADRGDGIFANLAAVPGGTAFLEGHTAYLEQYGSRGDGWFELSTPTPKENPTVLLEQIRQMLDNDEPDPELAVALSVRLRQETTQRLRDSLSDNPEKLTEFNRVLEGARQYVPVKEDRGLWQLTIPGSLRVPCLAAGKLLADQGALDSADDIFYLHLNEIEELAAAPAQGEWRQLVATRRKSHEAHKASNPPANFGGEYQAGATQPQAPDETSPLMAGDVLKGIPASAGVIEGRAVVVRTLQEADKLEAGDILICNSTSPAWSMLFSRISAVVTIGGGPLSHTAIVAREYKIPCVLDVKGVTVKVQDGMRIRVDGSKGTVELV
jgi:pyruvate,water dikinase